MFRIVLEISKQFKVFVSYLNLFHWEYSGDFKGLVALGGFFYHIFSTRLIIAKQRTKPFIFNSKSKILKEHYSYDKNRRILKLWLQSLVHEIQPGDTLKNSGTDRFFLYHHRPSLFYMESKNIPYTCSTQLQKF